MAYHPLTHDISERTHGYLPCQVNKLHISHTRLEQQWKKNAETTFVNLSRFAVEKKKSRK